MFWCTSSCMTENFKSLSKSFVLSQIMNFPATCAHFIKFLSLKIVVAHNGTPSKWASPKMLHRATSAPHLCKMAAPSVSSLGSKGHWGPPKFLFMHHRIHDCITSTYPSYPKSDLKGLIGEREVSLPTKYLSYPSCPRVSKGIIGEWRWTLPTKHLVPTSFLLLLYFILSYCMRP